MSYFVIERRLKNGARCALGITKEGGAKVDVADCAANVFQFHNRTTAQAMLNILPLPEGDRFAHYDWQKTDTVLAPQENTWGVVEV